MANLHYTQVPRIRPVCGSSWGEGWMEPTTVHCLSVFCGSARCAFEFVRKALCGGGTGQGEAAVGGLGV